MKCSRWVDYRIPLTRRILEPSSPNFINAIIVWKWFRHSILHSIYFTHNYFEIHLLVIVHNSKIMIHWRFPIKFRSWMMKLELLLTIFRKYVYIQMNSRMSLLSKFGINCLRYLAMHVLVLSSEWEIRIFYESWDQASMQLFVNSIHFIELF